MSHTGDTLSTARPYEQTSARWKRRALVVDEDSTRELRRHLILAGFDVERVSDSAAALERARADRFDVVVFDLTAHRVDDLVLCRRSDRIDVHGATRTIHWRNVTLDADRRDTIVGGVHVHLTRHEFDLLYLLASRPGVVFSRAALLSKVWSDDVYVTERTVDTVVSRVRKKLQRAAGDQELIATAWGVGYKFVDAG
jgi:DNA-binding response OmpR family regulator